MTSQKKIYVSYTRADSSGVVEPLRDELAAAGYVAIGDWELRPVTGGGPSCA